MKKAVITGSFDPITKGHIFLIEQARLLFDKIYVCMLINPDKTYFFSYEQRMAQIVEATKAFDNVEVAGYNGYAVDFCKSVGAELMVRGIRNHNDLQYELNLRRLNWDFGKIDTMFILADDNIKNISSSNEREKLRSTY